MNGYLVLAGTTMDNVPMGLFPTLARAAAFGAYVTEGQVKLFARDVLGVDISDKNVICVQVVEFRNGVPYSIPDGTVKDFGN